MKAVMGRRHLVCAIAAMLCASTKLSAFESDQFTLPPALLADIGPEIDEYLRQIIDQAIERTNRRIDQAVRSAAAASDAREQARYQAEAESLLDEGEIAGRLRDVAGVNLPESTIEAWMARHTFRAQPDRFAPRYSQTIYGASILLKPLLAGAVSPTVRVHGTLIGMDKIGHFIQQGHDYYLIRLRNLQAGKPEAQATRKAVDFGVTMESTWGGQWWTGAYSNADLAANYAGMKFHMNLTHPVAVGGRTWPAILTRDGGRWAWNPAGDGHLIQPFVTEHWDESFNPSWYDGPMRPFIRAGILARAADWIAHHRTDQATEQERFQRVQHWFGEPYGHSGPDELITIVNTHFQTVAGSAAGK